MATVQFELTLERYYQLLSLILVTVKFLSLHLVLSLFLQ